MNTKPKREQVGQKFFATFNYKELGVEKLLEDFEKFQDEADVLCGPEGRMNLLSVWEERGLDTGNPHLHAIIILKREGRTRCPALAN